jgi:uncharacterized membrane protein YidH (DUF202 family)
MAGTGPRPAGPDPARQPERTYLAWRRTVLAATVVALLAGRLAIREPATPARLLVAAAVLGGWLAILLASSRRIGAMRTRAPEAARWSVRVTTLVAVGYAVLGMALVAAGWAGG